MAGDGVITKRHSDKKGRSSGFGWTQSDRLAPARDILRPDGAHPASHNARPEPSRPARRRPAHPYRAVPSPNSADRQDPLPACYLDDEPYRRRILTQLRLDGYPVEDADVERLSPLTHDHIDLLGRYHFTNPDNRGDGRLRPLRDPRTARGLKAAITTP